ncbi:MAG: futalosine hydrolase [Pedobacter sp.]|nr:MAG: futalosine hydrolase [Pedobacter sp.]
MKLLVVAATQKELNQVYEHFNLANQDFIQTEQFDILITGVGMTATAFALGTIINDQYNLVLNVGIAGSFDIKIPLGNLVTIKTDVLAELGAEDNDDFLTIDELGFGTNTFSATYFISDLQQVNAITVNKVHGNAESIKTSIKRFNPTVESMEGAAVFYACNKSNIPCVQVRAISNYVEPRNRDNWQIGLAVKNLNDWLIRFITNL